MPLARQHPDPPPEQRRRLDAFLAELAPAIPTGLSLDPRWEPELAAWILWLPGAGSTPNDVYSLFVDSSHDLADRHGVEMTLAPAEFQVLD